MSRAISAPVVLILLTAIFAGMFMLAWPTLREQFILIQEQLPPALEGVQQWFEEQLGAVAVAFGDGTAPWAGSSAAASPQS